MKTEKIIGAICTIGFILLLVVVGNKVGSSAGKQAAERKLEEENIEFNGNQNQQSNPSLVDKVFSNQDDKSKHVTIIHNMRQLGLALVEFEVYFGNYPNHNLTNLVKEKGKKPNMLDNKYLFSQLLASGVLDSNHILRTHPGTEGDWLYYGNTLTSKSNPREVMLISPIVRGKRGVLRLDCSVQLMLVEEADKLSASIDTQPIHIPQLH